MVNLPIPEKPSAALREAIERTFEATASTAAGTRDRAADLLDDVAKRGRDVRDQLGKLEGQVRDRTRRKD